MVSESRDITGLLERAHAGDRAALDELAGAVYRDLLGVARRTIARRDAGRARPVTLEPAELVHETFIKLLGQRADFRNREHFFAIATRIMTRVLLDYAKARGRQKRSGNRIRLSLSALGRAAAAPPDAEVHEVMDLLERLEALDDRVARVARLRILWGLGTSETAELTGLSRATVDRDWRFARTWLAEHL